MAKKKKTRAGQHLSKKMFRVEEDIHAAFQLLSLREDRPMSRIVRRAHEKLLREAGVWPWTPALQAELERLQEEQG